MQAAYYKKTLSYKFYQTETNFLPLVPFFVSNLKTSSSEPANGSKASQTRPLLAFLTMIFLSPHEFKYEKTLI